MASADTEVLVKINGDANGLEKAAKSSRDSVRRTGDEARTAGEHGRNLGGHFRAGFAAVAAAATVGIASVGQFAKSSLESYQSASSEIAKYQQVASNAGWSNDIQSQASKAFGVISAGAARSAATTAASMGVSGEAYRSVQGAVGDLAVKMGGVRGASDAMAGASQKVSKAIATGSASALSRYGIVLDDATSKQFANANQTQRAQILADALHKSVGGLNDRLAQTPAGQMQQLSNSISAVKYNFGGLLSGETSPEAFTQSLTTMINQGIGLIKTMAPKLAQGVASIATSLAQAAPGLVTGLINGLLPALPALINAITTMIPSVTTAIVNAIPQIIQALLTSLPQIIQGLMQLILGIVSAIPQIIQGLIGALPTIITMLVQGFLQNLPAIIQGAIMLVVALVAAIPQIIMALIQAIPQIIMMIGQTLVTQGPQLIASFKNLFDQAVNGIKSAFSGIGEWFSGIWGHITGVFAGAGNWFKGIGRGIWDGITGALKGIGGWFGNLWGSIVGAAKAIPGRIISTFEGLGEKIWNTIKHGLRSVLSAVPVVGGSIVRALGLAQGGIVPGDGTATEDNQITALSPGEFVVNNKAAHQIGYDALRLINTGQLPVVPAGGNNNTINVQAAPGMDIMALTQQMGFMLRTI